MESPQEISGFPVSLLKEKGCSRQAEHPQGQGQIPVHSLFPIIKSGVRENKHPVLEELRD